MSSQSTSTPVSQPAIVNAAEWNNAARIIRHNSPTNVHFDPSMSSAQQLEILRALGLVHGNGTPYQGTAIFNGAEFNNSATTIERIDSETNLSFGTRAPFSRPSVSQASSHFQAQGHRLEDHETLPDEQMNVDYDDAMQSQGSNAASDIIDTTHEAFNTPHSQNNRSQQQSSDKYNAPEGVSRSRTY